MTTTKAQTAGRTEREVALAKKIGDMRARAEKLQAESDRLNATINRDWNYWTQPIQNTSRGRAFAKQRDKARERGFKASEMGCEAAKLRKEADRLEKLGVVMPEDRLAAHQAKIAAVKVEPGQMVDTVHYGIREVLKVNRLSVTVKSSVNSFGGTGKLNVPKEFIRGVVT
jgi:hypothetical protein